jgi:hypothetical protein
MSLKNVSSLDYNISLCVVCFCEFTTFCFIRFLILESFYIKRFVGYVFLFD